MIVIVEGIDRVGKTTLVNKLVQGGFINLKDEFILGDHNLLIDSFEDYSVGKCESFYVLAKSLSDSGKNVVIDRLYLTELVYGACDRLGSNQVACFGLDTLFENEGAILCWVKANDLELSNKLAGVDQTKKEDMFKFYFDLSSNTNKIICDYTTIDATANEILSRASKYDFYFASPFFNEEQVEREERMIKHLRNLGFSVFSPKEASLLDAKASQLSRKQTFEGNCEAINNSRAVFAVTDGKDMGTIWEAGYAYGINKPVIYFAETLGDNKFNLMLAQSGRDVFMSQDEVTYGALIDSLNGASRRYRGDIE